MCKIFTMTNTSRISTKDVPKLVNVVANALEYYEKDGFGYAIQGVDGVFGEKSYKRGFKYGTSKNQFLAPFLEQTAQEIGKESKPNGPALFHGRTSTNNKNLVNTHPLQKRDWTLIHNGVVDNEGPKYDMFTTNDTEHLLEYMSTTGISGVEKYLSGYYAVTAIDPEGKLHIFRDDQATLFCCSVKSIDSYLFATTEDILEHICKAMKWKRSKISRMKNNTYIVFSGTQLVHHADIKPLGYNDYQWSHASKSIGASIESNARDSKVTYYSDKWSSGSTTSSTGSVKSEAEVYRSESKWDVNQELFFREIDALKESDGYTFYFRGEELQFSEFEYLHDDDKMDCLITRPDGSEVCPENYSNPNFSSIVS